MSAFDDWYRHAGSSGRNRRFGRGEVVCPDCGEEFRRPIDVRAHNCEKRGRGGRKWFKT